MKDNLTPEQRACIQEATQALERLRDLMPVEDTQEDARITPEEFTEGVNEIQDYTMKKLREVGHLIPHQEPANLTPEQVFMIVTCNGQREMTLQRFKDAIRHLTI